MIMTTAALLDRDLMVFGARMRRNKELCRSLDETLRCWPRTLPFNVILALQVFCDLGMRNIRDSRHSLLIEKCRQLDSRKLQDLDKMRWVGKMFVKMEHVVTMRDIHFLGPSVKRGLSPDKEVGQPKLCCKRSLQNNRGFPLLSAHSKRQTIHLYGRSPQAQARKWVYDIA